MIEDDPVSEADRATHLAATAGVWVALKASGTLAVMSSFPVDTLSMGSTRVATLALVQVNTL